jgi:putative peptide maturation system protein
MPLSDVTAGEVNGRKFSVGELLYTLKITDRLDVLRQAVDDVLILEAIKERGIEVSDDELQSEADKVRKEMGLLRADATQQWLEGRSMSVDDFENYLRRSVAARKLRAQVTKDGVKAYFDRNRPSFDSARLCRLVVEDEKTGKEIIEKLRSKGTGFSDLAMAYSVEAGSKQNAGHIGVRRRTDLSPAVAKAVFAAKPGDVIGPIEVNGVFHVLRVDAVERASLDDETKRMIEEALFSEWLDREAEKASTKFTLPGSLSAN